VNKDFRYFAERLGLDEAEQLSVDSPFDYDDNTRLWIPDALPPPGGEAHTQALLQLLLPVLQANDGSAILPFTTHRALRQAAAWLTANSDFNLQVQGSAPRAQLLQRFRQQPRSLLLGAASFWEGVDVVGAGLSIVVIDKLPFGAPDDPVYQARADAISSAGGSAFADLSLPEAVLALKQGVGRLIRHQQDYGLVVLGDQRIRSKSYGRQFLHSLPIRKHCESAQQAIAFLQHKQEHAEHERSGH
jgi:ATP-dependent DNA helicase DinG